MCTWTSINPGVTILPFAEMTFRARLTGMSAAISKIFPSFTATSRGECNFCEGSITVPPLISKSQVPTTSLSDCKDEVVAVQILPGPNSVVLAATKHLENSRRVGNSNSLLKSSRYLRNLGTAAEVNILKSVRQRASLHRPIAAGRDAIR